MTHSPLDMIPQIGMFLIPFLLALCVHEYAHGWVAFRLGDPTAKLMGRLTLNPISHADIIGTILLPVMSILMQVPFFGWAKPVPVNPNNLKNQRMGMFWVALAGPGSNIIMAFLGVFVYVLSQYLQVTGASSPLKAIMGFSITFVKVNLALAFFNLLPVHPLDGGKIIGAFLPYRANRWLEENQFAVSLVLMMLFLSGILGAFLTKPMQLTAEAMEAASRLMVGKLFGG